MALIDSEMEPQDDLQGCLYPNRGLQGFTYMAATYPCRKILKILNILGRNTPSPGFNFRI